MCLLLVSLDAWPGIRGAHDALLQLEDFSLSLLESNGRVLLIGDAHL